MKTFQSPTATDTVSFLAFSRSHSVTFNLVVIFIYLPLKSWHILFISVCITFCFVKMFTKQESPAIADKPVQCFRERLAVYKTARLLYVSPQLIVHAEKESVRLNWPASITIRCNRIAYWQRKRMFGIGPYVDLPGRTDDGRTDGDQRLMREAAEQCVSLVRWCNWSQVTASEINRQQAVVHVLIEPGEYLSKCSNFCTPHVFIAPLGVILV